MNITKPLYLFLIILFIIILIIVIFKSVIPLIKAGVEIKGYIGNLKGSFDIEISKDDNASLAMQNYHLSEQEEHNNQYSEISQQNIYQPSYVSSEHEEQHNQYGEVLSHAHMPSEHEEQNNQYSAVSHNAHMPSEHEEQNNQYSAVSHNSYMPSEHEEQNNVSSQLLFTNEEEDNSNIDEYLNVIEEEGNNNLIFNSYIPLTKLSDYDTELSNMNIHKENIIESFDSVDGYDNPIFVMFYAPWCTFSKKALPHFQKLMQNYQGKINIALVNCEDEKDVAIKHKVQQYPTIRYYPNGMNVPQYVDYNKGRDYDSYIQYLKLVTDTII